MSCRICKNKELDIVIDLGYQSNGSLFPSNKIELKKSPLSVVMCSKCYLVQLNFSSEHPVAEDLYMNGEYGYHSGINPIMVNHIKMLVSDIENTYIIKEKNNVIDIGANDGTLLKFYNNLYHKIAVDPTISQFKKYYENTDIVQIPKFFSKENIDLSLINNTDVITSLSMFYDLPDPISFAKDISCLLNKTTGVWITEQSYIGSMLERFSFDTICHEHLEYYSFHQMEWIEKLTDLKIVDVTLNECNGGSFRITFAHKESDIKVNHENIKKIKEKEKMLCLTDKSTYKNFSDKCNNIKESLLSFLKYQKETGKQICLYGASTKGNTLLQYFGIDDSLIQYAAERNPSKYGKFTPSTNIIIKSEEEVRKMNPDFMLVLPWHFREGIIKREEEYLNNGGQIIFPLPEIQIYTTQKINLITGITGQLGTYLVKLLKQKEPKCIIYGTVNKNQNYNNSLFYIPFKNTTDFIGISMWNTNCLYNIYNFASISDAQESVINPLNTIELNGVFPLKLCEKILQTNNKIKLFQTCSSEMFKGIKEKIISEKNLELIHPVNPYGIAKLLAYWECKYYRENYNLFIINGIIFNTESKLRGKRFLTSKISQIVKDIMNGNLESLPYKIDRIDMYRDFSHASDVVNGIWLAMNNIEKSQDFVIGSGISTCIKDLIIDAFALINKKIYFEEINNKILIRDFSLHTIYIEVQNLNRSYENNTENLVANNTSIKQIGWQQQFTIKDILNEMIYDL